jgi:hypothetical protein
MDGIGLADAIEKLREEVLLAYRRSGEAEARFPIQTLTVSLKVGLTKSVEGKAGFTVPFVGAELGASGGLDRENSQTVTLVLGPPVDRSGNTILVGDATNERKD